jgi:hypothetical protein
MKFKKVIQANEPKDLAEQLSNKYLRTFETKVWSAFNDLEDNLVMNFRLDSLRPFMQKIQKEVEDFTESLDPRIKEEITRLLTERQNKYR